MQRINNELAYVLHTRAFRETSLIVDLLRQNHGRVSVVARSARGPRSRYRGLLQPFMPLMVSWVAKSELGTLRQAETQGMPLYLQGKALWSGLYLNEILMRLLLRNESIPELFLLYARTLQNLVKMTDCAPALRYFEKHLLQILGYEIILDKEAISHEPVVTEAFYLYKPQQGLQKVGQEQARNAAVFKGASLLALHEDNLYNQQYLRDAKRLLRYALQTLLGDKTLYSRECFAQLVAE